MPPNEATTRRGPLGIPSNEKAELPMMPRNTVQTAIEVPALQWANGRTEARPLGTGRFIGHVGFHSECGRDDDFDAWCIDSGVTKIEIRHPRDTGAPAIVAHWDFGSAIRFFPITSGPAYASVQALIKARDTAQSGIGAAWPQGERSRLAVRGFLMIGRAYTLVQLGVRSKMTEHLLAALIDHTRACEAADGLVDRAKHPDPVCLHEIALTLGAGDERPVGRKETTMITPFVSGHPAVLALPYLWGAWRPEALHSQAMEAWDSVVAWAQEYAAPANTAERPVYEDAL